MMHRLKTDKKGRCFQLSAILISFCLGITIGTYYMWGQHINPWISSVNHWDLGLNSRKLYADINRTTTRANLTTILTTSAPLLTTPQSLDDAMVEEQSKRQITLRRTCERDNLLLYQKQWMEYKKYDYILHIIVDDHYKILFNYVPKISCTMWKSVFMKIRQNYTSGYYRRLQEYSDEEIQMRLATYRKVLFVREPITRLLSAFLNKFHSQPKYLDTQKIWEATYGQEIVTKYRRGGFVTPFRTNSSVDLPLLDIQLDEFIRFITDKGVHINMDEFRDHWLPIHRVANPCVIKYDFIGLYENLAVEGPYALKWMGVDNVQFPEVHDSRAIQSLIQAYQKVPLDLLRRLWEFYKLDYEMFGYSINDTMSTLMNGIFD